MSRMLWRLLKKADKPLADARGSKLSSMIRLGRAGAFACRLLLMCVAATGTSTTDAALARWQPLRIPYRSAALNARELALESGEARVAGGEKCRGARLIPGGSQGSKAGRQAGRQESAVSILGSFPRDGQSDRQPASFSSVLLTTLSRVPSF